MVAGIVQKYNGICLSVCLNQSNFFFYVKFCATVPERTALSLFLYAPQPCGVTSVWFGVTSELSSFVRNDVGAARQSNGPEAAACIFGLGKWCRLVEWVSCDCAADDGVELNSCNRTACLRKVGWSLVAMGRHVRANGVGIAGWVVMSSVSSASLLHAIDTY